MATSIVFPEFSSTSKWIPAGEPMGMLLGTCLLLLYLAGIPGIPLPGKAALLTQPGPTTTPRQNHPSLFDATPPPSLTKCVFPPVPGGLLARRMARAPAAIATPAPGLAGSGTARLLQDQRPASMPARESLSPSAWRAPGVRPTAGTHEGSPSTETR